MASDIFIAEIMANEFEISSKRIGIYGTAFDAPEDEELYILVKTQKQHIVGSTIRFDQDTNEEIKSVTSFVDISVELTSKNRDAYNRKEEMVMALTSVFSLQSQELNNFKVFRTGEIIDLSFIEGSSSLYRFRLPIRVTELVIKRTVVDYFDKYRVAETTFNKP